ncbi:hypothetical protein B0I35DRAFT_156520 [Stachybotrys elegans]|uniref:Ketoreductase domain-containing protein n=1 Tax=Stachybotrys elegans TaxID=80388 RepID=A0A8K0SDL6_9HYPO|nr:hypothetical protein B0I35DRAFT_156520 [Stachybotrys elegans]
MALDTLDLTSKTAVVTGSGRESGIGAAIARGLARNGAAVTVHYVSESSSSTAAKVAQGIRDAGGRATVVQADVNSPQGAEKIVAETLKAFGVDKIDILVNNAGRGAIGSLMNATTEQLLEEFGVNTFGPLYMSQAVVGSGRMPQGGRIVNIGSVVSKMGMNGLAIYSASKAAQDSFTEALAEELGGRGITVNIVAPGPVGTGIVLEMNEKLGADFTAPLRAKARGSDRLADPEDISEVVVWLATERARWITAQFISASAGINGTS